MTKKTTPQTSRRRPVAQPRPSTPQAQLATFLSRFPPGILTLAKRCLAKLRRTFPGSYEMVYDYPHSVVVAFGTSDRGYEALVAFAVLKDSVRLYFDKSLPDPHGLLEGTGGKVRSVALKAATEIDAGPIKALTNAAIKNAGAKFPRSGKTQMIVKSAPKKSKRA